MANRKPDVIVPNVQLYRLNDEEFVLTQDGEHFRFPNVPQGWKKREPYDGNPVKEKLLPLTPRDSSGTGAPRAWSRKPRESTRPDKHLTVGFFGPEEVKIYECLEEKAFNDGVPTAALVKAILREALKP